MIFISYTLISLPTYTTAAMAHDLLAGQQIPSDIVRSSVDRSNSCGYSIKTDSRYRQTAETILRQSRFPVLRVTDWQ